MIRAWTQILNLYVSIHALFRAIRPVFLYIKLQYQFEKLCILSDHVARQNKDIEKAPIADVRLN